MIVGGDDGATAAAERAARVASWANRARDLSNSPPNELTPERLAERASELAPDGVQVESLRSKADPRAEHGRVRRGRAGRAQRATPDRHALRAGRCEERSHARPRRQGDHVRHRRHLAQAGARHGEHEGRHVGRRGGRRRDVRDRRPAAAAARDRGHRFDGEHAGRPRIPPRRHPHRRERQDDRGHEHRCGRTARARRCAVVRARAGRDARHGSRDADRRDGGGARRPLRRLLRERRRVGGRDLRRGRGERRPHLAHAAPSALPPLREVLVRGHEELVRPARGRSRCSQRSS